MHAACTCGRACECGHWGCAGVGGPVGWGPGGLGSPAEEGLLLLFGLTGVYCYRVNRRLFLVPADPGTPCRLCRKPRDQRGAGTLAEPAQVRVSIPPSVLDPPHRHRIHRRKSFDASDTLALPRHCLLGWDIIPPKSEKSSAPKTLDLWSSVSPEAHHQKLSATSCPHLAVPMRVPPPTPIWSEPSSMPRPRSPKPKP